MKMKASLCRRIIVFAFAILPVNKMSAAADPGTLSVYWADVEGGAGTLIVTPAGESVLIDTGMPGGRDSKRIHDLATRAIGLKKIDYLIITHFHIDHFGGAA